MNYKKINKGITVSFFEDNKMNIKKIWSGIREIVNIRNSKPQYKIAQLKVGGKIINNSKNVSNKLFFAIKFMKQRNQYDDDVSHDKVLDIIKSLEYKSARGHISKS